MDADTQEFFELVGDKGLWSKAMIAADKSMAKQTPDKLSLWCEYYYHYNPVVAAKVEASVAGMKDVEVEDIQRVVMPLLQELMALDYVKYRREHGHEGCAVDEGSLNPPESKDGDDGGPESDMATCLGGDVRSVG